MSIKKKDKRNKRRESINKNKIKRTWTNIMNDENIQRKLVIL